LNYQHGLLLFLRDLANLSHRQRRPFRQLARQMTKHLRGQRLV